MQASLGLQKGAVAVHTYTPYWTEAFEKEKAFLLERFSHVFLEISHGGSTSVPGLSAKPIIDVFVAMRNLSDYQTVQEELEVLGYEYYGEDGVPGRHFFLKVQNRRGTHHIQLMTYDSPHWENHLALREYYRAHPQIRDQYAALKRELAERYPDDRNAYNNGKKSFVNATLEKARAYYRARGA